MLPYSVELVPSESDSEKLSTEEEKSKRMAACRRQETWSRHHIDEVPCGACALYDLNEMGADYVKIVGRGNQTWRKAHDINFIRLLLAILKDTSISREEYRDKARELYQYAYKRRCRTIMCYYPEVMVLERILTQ